MSRISSDGLFEGMLLAFMVVALPAFGKFFLISFAGAGSTFLSLMVILLTSSLALMLLMLFMYKLEALKKGQFLDATIFVAFTSLFGLVLFIPAVYYLAGWWIIHVIGIIILLSLILAKIMVGLIAGKTLHFSWKNKKNKKIAVTG